MSQSFLLEELQKGPASWNEWRRAHPTTQVDLRGAYLAETNLRGYDLHGADFSEAKLVAADLTNTDLRGANLSRADIRFAEFSGAKLTGAHFDGTDGVTDSLLKASLPGSDLLPWRWIAAAAMVAVLVVASFRLDLFSSKTAGAAGESASDAAQRLDDYERLTHEIRRAEFASWRIEAVDVADDLVTLRINRDEVTDDSYLLTLAAACGAVLEAPEAPVREIRILNRSGAAGWIYDSPRNCSVLLQAPIATLRLSAAANSRPYNAPEDF